MGETQPTPPGDAGPPAPSIQERLQVLNALSAALGSCATQHELFRVLGRELHRLGLDITVLLVTPDGRRLGVAYESAGEFLPESQARMSHISGQQWYEVEFSLDKPTLMRAVLEDGQIRLVPNVVDDLAIVVPEIFGQHQATILGLYPSWRAIYAPLKVGNKIIGMLKFFSESLTVDDEVILGTFANFLGAMLESVRRQEAVSRHIEQMEILHFVSQEISAAPPTLDALLRAVQEGLTAEVRYERARVGLLRDGEIVFAAGAGQPAERLPLSSAHPLARVARTGLPALIPDLQHEHGATGAPLAPESASLLAVPLLGGVERDQVAGILSVESGSRHAFDEHDRTTLEALANNLLTALHNVRLYEHVDHELERRVAELQTLLQIGQVVTGSLDFEEVLNRVLQLATRALDVEYGWISLIDEESQELVLSYAAGEGFSPLYGTRMKLAGTITEWMGRHETVLSIPDLQVEGWYTPKMGDWPGSVTPRNALFALLVRRGCPVGTMSLFNRRHGTFDEADVSLARSISLWATLALENVDLHRESVDKAAALELAISRMAEALNSRRDLQATLDTILDLAIRLAKADAGSVLLLSADGLALHQTVSRNLPARLNQLVFPVEGSIEGDALRQNRLEVVDDVLADPRLIYPEETAAVQVRSQACAPLQGRTGPLGALTVFRRQVRPFDTPDLNMLASLAQQAAAAIEQSRLADETLEQAARLNAIMASTREMIAVINIAGEVEYVNPAIGRQYAHLAKPGFHVSETLKVVAGAEEGEYGTQMWRRFLATGESAPFEVDTLDDAGGRHRMLVRPSVLVPGRRFLCIVSDVTDDYRLERLRYEFLRHIHHELRSPLAGVLGFLELLLNEQNLDAAKRAESLQLAYQGARQLRVMMDELQIYTLLGEPTTRKPSQRCDLQQIVEPALDGVRRIYQGVTFRNRLAGTLPAVACERGNMVRIVRHLLDNAAKFSPGGGVVEVLAKVEDGYVRLSVRDEGIGISPDRLQEIFTPFHQLDHDDGRSHRGIGLGLSLVRRVLEAAGGRLEVQSAPGQGSTFTMILPIA